MFVRSKFWCRSKKFSKHSFRFFFTLDFSYIFFLVLLLFTLMLSLSSIFIHIQPIGVVSSLSFRFIFWLVLCDRVLFYWKTWILYRILYGACDTFMSFLYDSWTWERNALYWIPPILWHNIAIISNETLSSEFSFFSLSLSLSYFYQHSIQHRFQQSTFQLY